MLTRFLANIWLRECFDPKLKFDLQFDKRCINFLENFKWSIWEHLLMFDLVMKELQFLALLERKQVDYDRRNQTDESSTFN